MRAASMAVGIEGHTRGNSSLSSNTDTIASSHTTG